jgi:hypothetical protein
VTASAVAQLIAAAPIGPVTVRPLPGLSVTVAGELKVARANVTLDTLTITGIVTFDTGSSGSKLVNSSALGFDILGADNIVIEGNTLDGKGVDNQNVIWDQPAGNTPDGWRISRNSLSNYYRDDGSHSEAIYIGYSTNGLIEGNTFTNNGNTGHLFFTWYGSTANPSTSYPRQICVRGNTFNETHGAYYDIDFRNEIPLSAGIKIDPGQGASLANNAFAAAC